MVQRDSGEKISPQDTVKQDISFPSLPRMGRQKTSINFNTESWAVAKDLVGWFMGGRSKNEGTGDKGGKQQALLKGSRTLNLSCHIRTLICLPHCKAFNFPEAVEQKTLLSTKISYALSLV